MIYYCLIITLNALETLFSCLFFLHVPCVPVAVCMNYKISDLLPDLCL